MASTTDSNLDNASSQGILCDVVGLLEGPVKDVFVDDSFNDDSFSDDSFSFPDIQWLQDWLQKPKRTTYGFKLVIDRVEEFLFNDGGGCHTYVLGTIAQAMAHQCPIWSGKWEKVAWKIFYPIVDERDEQYIPNSSSLATWIFQILSSQGELPSLALRFKMFLTYLRLIDINNNNKGKLMGLLLSLCSELDRNSKSCDRLELSDIENCFLKFDGYECTLDLKIKKKLIEGRNNSHATPPKEINILTALLNYTCPDGIHNEICLMWATNFLAYIVCRFKHSLQQPELVNITAKSILLTINAVLRSEADIFQNFDLNIQNLEFILDDLCKVNRKRRKGLNALLVTPFGQEISKSHQKKISKLKSMATKEFEEEFDKDTILYQLIYNFDN